MLGRHVGVYEIVAKLGEGGMGEVYRARDSRLKRDVALKVLPSSVAGDAHRLSRFEREAQVLAALNHPNIAAIYGIEQGALVLELVEGATLADMIAADRLPLREALSIARQICEALDAAHEQGIVHRDLKPANIKVRPDGSVKVLDFGLAKAIEAAPGPDVAASTITSPAVVSAVGVILGTAAYMSPEQARGKPVDKRSDVWAFGCVLFEMLTGQRAFDGDSVTDTLSRVLQREPDFSLLPADTPQTIRRLLRRCLEKDRQNRLPHIAAATFQIDEALAAFSSGEIAADRAPASTSKSWFAAAIIVSVVAGAAVMWAVMSRRAVVPLPVTRLQVSILPADQLGGSEGRPNRSAFALSPDGRLLVFSALKGKQRALYLRPLDQSVATLIPGTEGALNPVFSPDGRWIAYCGVNQIQKVPVAGGPPVPVGPGLQRVMNGLAWGDDDMIVFARATGGLFEVPAAGGTPVERTAINREQGEVSHRLPHVLPGGDAVLYTVTHNRFPAWNETQVWVHSRRSKTSKLLIEGGADARYVASGHVLYANEGALLAIPFDLDRLAITGGAIGISDVMQAAYMPGQPNDSGAMQASVSRTGTLVYLAGGVQKPSEHTVVRVDRSGRPDGLQIAAQTLRTLRLSPDGAFLALGAVGRERGISLYDIERGSLTRLTTAGRGVAPVWTPDGERLTYAVAAKGPDNVFSVRADGAGTPEPIVKHAANLVPTTWTPDGRRLLFHVLPSESAAASSPDRPTIYVQDVAGKGEPVPLSQVSRNFGSADLSPDGRWLAYNSSDSGETHVFVDAYPGPGPRFQVSSEGGGASPVWSGDGRELFYVRATLGGQTMESGDVDLAVMSVMVTTQPKMSLGRPRLLFSGRYGVNGPARAYDVTRDGQHFYLMQLRKRPPDVITEMSVVQNWIEELKRQQ